MVERIKQLLAPPVFPEDHNKTRAASVLNTLLLAILALLIFNTLRALLIAFEPVPVLLNAINLPIALALLFFLRRGNVRGSSLATVSLFWLVVTLVSVAFSGVDIIILSSYYVLVILAGLLLGRQASQLVALLSIVASALVFIAGENGWLTPAEGNPLVSLIASLSLLVVITVALNLNLKSLEGALLEREEKQRELERTQGELEKRVASRTRDLKLASEGARQLAQIRNLDELLSRAVETVQSSFDLYYTQLYLLDEAARQLSLRAGTGIVGQRLLNQRHFLSLDLRTINGAAVLERRTILVSDTGQDPLFYPNPLLPDTRSEIAVPLLLGEQALGVLNMQSREPGAFSQENVSVFETLAGQLAVALDNALLLAAQRETAVSLQQALALTEQQANRLARLNQMVAALDDSKEATEMVAVINRHVLPMFPGNHAAIALLDAPGNAYDWFVLGGEEAGFHLQETRALPETAVALAIRQNQIIQFPQDLPFDRFPDTHALAQAGMRRGLCAPLAASGKAFGALILACHSPGAYTQADLDIFRQVTTQFSNSLASRQLNERLSRLAAIVENNPDLVAISRLTGEIIYLNTTGVAMLGLPPDTDPARLTIYDFLPAEDAEHLLETGVPTALETGTWSSEVQLNRPDGAAFPASETITIYHEDGEPDSFFFTLRDITERKQAEQAQRNLTSQLEERLIQVNALQRAMTREGWSAFMTAADRLVQGYNYDGESLHLISRHDVKNAPLPRPHASDQAEDAGENPDTLASPISVRGETIGVLGFRSPDGAPISRMQQNLLNNIAQQLAEALERARLFEEMELARLQTDALYTGSERVIQARSLDEVLNALVEHTQLKQFERVDLVFFDTSWEDTPPRLLNVASTWQKEARPAPIAEKRSFKLSHFPFLDKKYRHKPFVCQDALTDERLDERTRAFIMNVQSVRSFLAFPLISGERWIGLVVAQSATPQNLTEQNVRQISSLVSQAATVSQTQRLFAEAQQRARREQMLREITNRVYAAADAESILRAAAQEISQALGLETFVYLEEMDGTETAVSNGRDQLANAPEQALRLNAGE